MESSESQPPGEVRRVLQTIRRRTGAAHSDELLSTLVLNGLLFRSVYPPQLWGKVISPRRNQSFFAPEIYALCQEDGH